jgi:hypothetical protein
VKLIYAAAGLPPAVVVLDTPAEIALVIEALSAFIPSPDQRELADELYLNLNSEGPA